MKKIIGLIIFIVIMYTGYERGISNVSMSSQNHFDFENKVDALIEKIEIEITKKEKEIINRTKDEPLRIGVYVQEYYYSKLYNMEQDKAIGNNQFIIDYFEKVGMNVEIVEIKNTYELSKKNDIDLYLLAPEVLIAISSTSGLLNNYVKTLNYYTEPLYYYSKEVDSKMGYKDLNKEKVGILELFYEEIFKGTLNPREKSIELEIFKNKVEIEEKMGSGELKYFLDFLSTDKIKEGYFISLKDTFIQGKNIEGYYNKDSDKEMFAIVNKILNSNNFKKGLREYRDLEIGLKIKEKYFFTEAEKEYIENSKKNPVIIVNYDYNSPTQFYDESTNKWLGAQPSIWDKIIEISGLNIKFSTDVSDTIEGIRKKLSDSNVTSGHASMILPQKKDDMDGIIFVGNELFSGVSLYSLNKDKREYNDSNIYNYVVGGIEGREAIELIKVNYFGLKVNDSYSTVENGIKALENGEIDLIALNDYQFKEVFFNNKNYSLKEQHKLPFILLFKIALSTEKEGYEELKSIIEKTLIHINEEKIYSKHYKDYVDIEIISTNLIYTIMGVLMTVTVIVLNYIYIYRSKVGLKEALTSLERVMYIDKITGLKNRVALYSKKSKKNTVLVLNIINFSRFNNQYGIKVGDAVLREVAKKLENNNSNRKSDNLEVFRIENDEFGIVSDDIKTEEWCIEVAKSIIEVFKNPLVVNGEEHIVKVAIGVSIGKENEKIEKVINKANVVANIVKKNKTEYYGIATNKKFKEFFRQRYLEQDLSNEFVEKQVVPFYQPKYNMNTNEMIGVETLARMNHDSLGLVYPDEFIPILEKINKIDLLDVYMLKQASKDFVGWQKSGLITENFRMSFNFSIISIEKNDILEIIKNVHREQGIAYKHLELEVTETAVSDNMEDVIRKLEDVSKLGVSISLDDFSAGNSNITRLSTMPIDTIKLDKGLLDSGVNEVTTELILSIKSFAEKMGLGIIIEGVETIEQVEFLKGIGLVNAQGYYYSKPVKNHEFIKKL